MIDTERLDQRPQRGDGLFTRVLGHTECAVEECSVTDTDRTRIHPLNPVDFDTIAVPLCPRHREWARKRNELARHIAEDLRRAFRDAVGEHQTRVGELAEPPTGTLGERGVGGLDAPPRAHARGE